MIKIYKWKVFVFIQLWFLSCKKQCFQENTFSKININILFGRLCNYALKRLLRLIKKNMDNKEWGLSCLETKHSIKH